MSPTPSPSFEELFVAAWPRLVRAAYAITRDRGRAEDAVQSAFAKAHASWWRVRAADDPYAYVRRAAVNMALEHERRASRRRESPRETVTDSAVTSSEDELLARDEMWQAIGALPPRQRAVIVLRYYEDLTEQEIAHVLGVRPGTVKSQASAALASLRARLSDASIREGGKR